MTVQSKAYLKSRFETGDTPTQQDYIDFIDTMYAISDDGAIVEDIYYDNPAEGFDIVFVNFGSKQVCFCSNSSGGGVNIAKDTTFSWTGDDVARKAYIFLNVTVASKIDLGSPDVFNFVCGDGRYSEVDNTLDLGVGEYLIEVNFSGKFKTVGVFPSSDGNIVKYEGVNENDVLATPVVIEGAVKKGQVLDGYTVRNTGTADGRLYVKMKDRAYSISSILIPAGQGWTLASGTADLISRDSDLDIELYTNSVGDISLDFQCTTKKV